MLPLLQNTLPDSPLDLDEESLEEENIFPDQRNLSSWQDYPNDDPTLYPESDGKPMAENTEQYDWIVIIKENLEILFAQNPQVFIAADLLWYPVQVEEGVPVEPLSVRSQAPDVMVIFDRPKGKRRSYRQWREENIPPQVVFEILSPSNKTRWGVKEMQAKFNFYQTYGVEEYYIYDPKTYKLQGWLRQEEQLESISNLSSWISPRLGIRFEIRSKQDLEIYYPDGRKFISSIELSSQAELAQQQAELAQQKAQEATSQLQQTALRLIHSGMSQQQVAEIMNLSQEQVKQWL